MSLLTALFFLIFINLDKKSKMLVTKKKNAKYLALIKIFVIISSKDKPRTAAGIVPIINSKRNLKLLIIFLISLAKNISTAINVPICKAMSKNTARKIKRSNNTRRISQKM